MHGDLEYESGFLMSMGIWDKYRSFGNVQKRTVVERIFSTSENSRRISVTGRAFMYSVTNQTAITTLQWCAIRRG